jgi:multidrug efflux system membrane fusion protein
LRSEHGANAAAKNSGGAVPVKAALVEKRTIPIRLSAVGNVEAFTAVAVKSRVDGQIIRVLFREGDRVAKGAPLFELDPRPFIAGVKQAEAALERDRAQLANATSQRNRYEDLLRKHFVSDEAFNQIRTNFDSAVAVVHADEANLDNLRLQLEFATIRSPIDGVAGRVLIQEGNLVKANDVNPLVTLNQVSPIYVAFSAPEQQLASIRQVMGSATQKVLATVPGTNDAAEGKLTFIDNAVDSTTGSIKLKAVFPNADRKLWPGQFVNVSLLLGQQADATVVPATAVQNGPEGQIAFVVHDDQTVEVRKVTLQRNTGDLAVVASGLAPGEKVVTEGQLRLADKSKVAIAQDKAP